MEDDCPNEAECELGVAVHNVLPPDVDQLDLLVPEGWMGLQFSKLLSETIDDLPEESECRFNILDGVEAHTTSFSRLKS